jgi:hypothetical protein
VRKKRPGTELFPASRLVPITSRSRRTSRQANPSRLRMVLHQDRSPTSPEGRQMRVLFMCR